MAYSLDREQTDEEWADILPEIVAKYFDGHDTSTCISGNAEAYATTVGNTRFVVFRGTASLTDLYYDLKSRRSMSYTQHGRVGLGFAAHAEQLTEFVDHEVQGRVESSLWLLGHSLGGAAAVYHAQRLRWPDVLTFGCPRVGDRKFSDTISHIRFMNRTDLVTRVPLTKYGFDHGNLPYWFSDNGLVRPTQHGSGVQMRIATFKSVVLAFLKFRPLDSIRHHALDAYANECLRVFGKNPFLPLL